MNDRRIGLSAAILSLIAVIVIVSLTWIYFRPLQGMMRSASDPGLLRTQFFQMNGAATLTPEQTRILRDYDLLFTISPLLLKIAGAGIFFALVLAALPAATYFTPRKPEKAEQGAAANP